MPPGSLSVRNPGSAHLPQNQGITGLKARMTVRFMESWQNIKILLAGALLVASLGGCSSGESSLQRGNMAFQKGELSEAEEFYQKALQSDATRSVASYNLGRVYFERGDYAKALELFDQALPVETEQPSIRIYRARAAMELGRLDEAERGFRSTVKIHPEIGEGYLYLAKFLAAQGDREEALKALQPALGFSELQEEATLLAANWQMEMQRPALAAALLDELLKTHGDRYQTYLELAKAHLAAGKTRSAELALRQGLTLNPGEVEGLFYLGVALKAQSQDDLAGQLFQAVVEKDEGAWREKAREQLEGATPTPRSEN